MAEINLTAQNFDEVIKTSDVPVLVDFWAAWCGPCKMLAPVIAELAEEQDGRVKVCKVNVDEEPSIAIRYGVSSIPTVIVFKNGEVAEKSIGYRPKEQLEALLG